MRNETSFAEVNPVPPLIREHYSPAACEPRTTAREKWDRFHLMVERAKYSQGRPGTTRAVVFLRPTTLFFIIHKVFVENRDLSVSSAVIRVFRYLSRNPFLSAWEEFLTANGACLVWFRIS